MHVEPRIGPALELIDASLLVGGGVPGFERRRARRNLRVGEPVDHHLAAGPLHHRIDDGAVITMADHRHRRAGEIRRGLDDAAIVQIAVEHRLLARIEMLAHRGMDAVGADQDVALGLAHGLAGRIGEARDDLVAALLEARQAMAGDDRLRAQPLADRARAAPCAARRAKSKSAASDSRRRGRAARSRSTGRACCRRRAPR